MGGQRMGYAPADGRARINRSSLPILFLAAKSSQDRSRVNLSEREKKKRLRLKQCAGQVRERRQRVRSSYMTGSVPTLYTLGRATRRYYYILLHTYIPTYLRAPNNGP